MQLSARERFKRCVGLAIALIPIIGSRVLTLGSEIPGLSCPLKRLIGIPCPAWGLTRSFIAIAHGHWTQAIHYHLFAPVLFLVFLTIIVHLILELITNRSIRVFYLSILKRPKFQIFAFLIVLGYHLTRLHQLAMAGDLQAGLRHSTIGQIFF
jgi:hypothetical protein